MPIKSKGIGQAWFYHAPAKPKCDEPVSVPPISQIPYLSGYTLDDGSPSDEKVSTKNWIKESDSDYIRLAKQGGRYDLLNMQPRHSTLSETPVGYPMCEWYYDEPPEAERPRQSANSTGERYQFTVPAYMVHAENKPRQSTDGYVTKEGPPTYSNPAPIESRPAVNKRDGAGRAGGTKKKTMRKPARTQPPIVRPVPCQAPPDHIGPNAIHLCKDP